MIPYQQLYRHDPESGQYGDCYRTCIACLLEVPPDKVPHFMDKEGWNNLELAGDRRDGYLKSKGLRLIAIPYSGGDIEGMLTSMKHTFHGMYVMLVGTSSNNVNHVVVYRDGQIVHDPSIDQSGIVGPASDGQYWVEFLLPYDIDRYLVEVGINRNVLN